MARLYCPNCESANLTWEAGVRMAEGIPNGRYNSHDATPILFVGCAECSETINVVDLNSEFGWELINTIPPTDKNEHS